MTQKIILVEHHDEPRDDLASTFLPKLGFTLECCQPFAGQSLPDVEEDTAGIVITGGAANENANQKPGGSVLGKLFGMGGGEQQPTVKNDTTSEPPNEADSAAETEATEERAAQDGDTNEAGGSGGGKKGKKRKKRKPRAIKHPAATSCEVAISGSTGGSEDLKEEDDDGAAVACGGETHEIMW